MLFETCATAQASSDAHFPNRNARMGDSGYLIPHTWGSCRCSDGQLALHQSRNMQATNETVTPNATQETHWPCLHTSPGKTGEPQQQLFPAQSKGGKAHCKEDGTGRGWNTWSGTPTAKPRIGWRSVDSCGLKFHSSGSQLQDALKLALRQGKFRLGGRMAQEVSL